MISAKDIVSLGHDINLARDIEWYHVAPSLIELYCRQERDAASTHSQNWVVNVENRKARQTKYLDRLAKVMDHYDRLSDHDALSVLNKISFRDPARQSEMQSFYTMMRERQNDARKEALIDTLEKFFPAKCGSKGKK